MEEIKRKYKMSTKFSKKEILKAEKEFEQNNVAFNGSGGKKRITKQVRVSIKIHKMLKNKAKERKITISKLLDKISLY